jgi:4-alpha-glucanotransferase
LIFVLRSEPGFISFCPYNAISALAFEPSLLTIEVGMMPGSDMPWVPGFTVAMEEKFRANASLRSDIHQGNIKYSLIKKTKQELLRAAFENLRQRDSVSQRALYDELQDFIKREQKWLTGYTLYRSLITYQQGSNNFYCWPCEIRTPSAAESFIRQIDKSNRRVIEEERLFHAYVQWVATLQWSVIKNYATNMGVELMGDMPYAVSRYSADVYQSPHLFDLEWSGGCQPSPFFKPDLFTETWGQNWGNAPYSWPAHAAEGYAWWKERVKRTFICCHSARQDCVVGYARQYCFPWLPERNKDFTRLSWEEAQQLNGGRTPQFRPDSDAEAGYTKNAERFRHIMGVFMDAAAINSGAWVAEDWGETPGYLRPILESLGIYGFALPLIDRPAGSGNILPASEIPRLKVATYGNHDNIPLVTYWKNLINKLDGVAKDEAEAEVRRVMQFLGRESPITLSNRLSPELHEAFLATLLNSDAGVVITAFQDIVMTEDIFNVPGIWDESTWTGRIRLPLSEYYRHHDYVGSVERFAGLIRKSGRLIT